MQTVIDWVLAHQLILSGLIVAVLDFIFAIIPTLQGNGILHSLYMLVKNITAKNDL